MDFFPKITLPNQLSYHEMVFTNIENITNIDKVSKYIEVEKSDEISLQNFITELKLLNIYDQLETKLHTNPEKIMRSLSNYKNL